MKKANSQRPMTNGQRLYLYLDTSEPEAVLAIYNSSKKGHSLFIKESWMAHRELSATLSEKYRQLLKEASIEASNLGGIAVFVGPGSFTGLRIGISFANGLAYGLGITIYETKEKEKFTLDTPKKVAVPFYGAEPNITKPKNKL